MIQGIKSIIYPVKDIAQAKALYTQLFGVVPYADTPYYVGYKVGDLDIGLDPNGHAQGMKEPIAYYHVSDIQAAFQAMCDAGAKPQRPVSDVGGGVRLAVVEDGDGNSIGLIQGA